MTLKTHSGYDLLNYLDAGNLLVNVGVFNALSAMTAAQFPQTKGLFISGLGFTYSHLGWPDVGLIDSMDVRQVAQIIRGNHPDLFVICDIDSGLGGLEQLRRTCVELKNLGVAAVQLEDQTQDDKRCGHMTGKVVRPREEAIERLRTALSAAHPMQVIARTDASMENGEALQRVEAFIQAGAKIVLVDGIKEKDIAAIRATVNGRAHIMVNIVGGGKLAQRPASEFHKLGISIVNLSTPLLFPAMKAMQETMESMVQGGWFMPETKNDMTLAMANEMVTSNFNRFVMNNSA